MIVDTCGELNRLTFYALFPDYSLFDGAAEVETHGFFDSFNLPPWDTWISYVHEHLLAWVPSALVELVDGGIQVNAEQCIVWADDGDTPFLRHPAVRPLLAAADHKTT